ncbi:uncharacterized protein LOC141858192 [Brevipalpus obovatus]|uniref:uncharacterized protein LOC141858192 n=1 Tax=Brevipalpus obovatus TaxID=246614 RepID=UPI003D9F0BBA
MSIYSVLLIFFLRFCEIFGDEPSHREEIVYVHDQPGSPKITVFVRLEKPSIEASLLRTNLTSHISSCMIHNSNELPTSRLLGIKSIKVSHNQIEEILDSCMIKNRLFDDSYLGYLVDMMTIGSIFPGTKWCGQGNISDNNDDLGYFDQVDACCRMHDMCPDYIDPNETKYALTNMGKISRFACQCDENFKNCLKNVKDSQSFMAKSFGLLYFDCFAPKCFKEDYPKECCSRYRDKGNEKCADFRVDSTKEPFYQWWTSSGFEVKFLSAKIDSMCSSLQSSIWAEETSEENLNECF